LLARPDQFVDVAEQPYFVCLLIIFRMAAQRMGETFFKGDSMRGEPIIDF
jgi:hypothetical protein